MKNMHQFFVLIAFFVTDGLGITKSSTIQKINYKSPNWYFILIIATFLNFSVKLVWYIIDKWKNILKKWFIQHFLIYKL